jgi:hypothetical protein
MSGTSTTYSTGGDGGAFNNNVDGTSGSANTGNGGGGADGNISTPPGKTGGSGGSGIVILKYPDTRTITIGSGLTGTTAAPSGGFKVTTITAGTGNVSFA